MSSCRQSHAPVRTGPWRQPPQSVKFTECQFGVEGAVTPPTPKLGRPSLAPVSPQLPREGTSLTHPPDTRLSLIADRTRTGWKQLALGCQRI